MRSLSLTFTALCMLVLCAFVLIRKPREPVSRAFCYFAGWAAIWALAVAVVSFPRTPVAWLVPVGHVAFMAPILATSAFLAFAVIFPDPRALRVSGRWVWGPYVFGGAWAVLAATPAVFRGVEIIPGAVPRPIYGPLFVPYSLSAVGCTLAAVGVLVGRFQRTPPGRDRLQLTYMLYAVGFAFAVATLLAIVLPLLGIRQFGSLAPLSLLVAFGGVTLAITKHRLFHLGLVFRQVLIATFAAVVLATVIGVLLTVTRRVVGDDSTLLMIGLVATATVAGLVLPTLRRVCEHVVDSYIFGGPPTDTRALRRLSQELTTMLSVQPLAELLVSGMGRALRLRHVTLYLPDVETDDAAPRWDAAASWPEDHPAPPELAADSPLMAFVASHSGPLMIDGLGRPNSVAQRALREQQAMLGADVVVPLAAEQQLVGLLVFSEKFDGDLLSESELALITTLAHQASTALANALLHEEIVRMQVHNENVLQGMVSGVIAVDRRGRLTTCNRRAGELLGALPADLIGEDESCLPDAIARPLRDARLHGHTTHEHRTLLELEHDTLTLSLLANPLRDAQGQTTGALIVFEDQTERMRLEAGLQRADRLASLGTLAAGLAHEIKNPLVSIRTLGQLLPEKYHDPEFRDTFAALAVGEVERINDLVERLLLFARPSPPTLQWVHVEPILDDVLQLVRAECAAHGVAVEREFGEPRVWVYADEAQLRQVFLNLFRNAIEALQDAPSRRLTVCVVHGPPGADPLRPPAHWTGTAEADALPAETELSRLTLTVADSGPGIREALREEIFNPFFTTKVHGTGLGLSVVAGIIREHGGRISAESAAAGGARFVIHFPALKSLPSPASVS